VTCPSFGPAIDALGGARLGVAIRVNVQCKPNTFRRDFLSFISNVTHVPASVKIAILYPQVHEYMHASYKMACKYYVLGAIAPIKSVVIRHSRINRANLCRLHVRLWRCVLLDRTAYRNDHICCWCLPPILVVDDYQAPPLLVSEDDRTDCSDVSPLRVVGGNSSNSVRLSGTVQAFDNQDYARERKDTCQKREPNLDLAHSRSSIGDHHAGSLATNAVRAFAKFLAGWLLRGRESDASREQHRRSSYDSHGFHADCVGETPTVCHSPWRGALPS
jgi:hypothetical protein